jgi:MFS family permease
MATAILSYTDRQVLSLLVDPLKADLGISDVQVSLLLGTAFALIYGVAGVPLGWLADRVSRRNLIAGGLIVWSLATLACGFARTFGEIFAGRLFVGLGEAALAPAAMALISDYFPPQRRGAAVGLFLSGIAVGVGASIFIGGAVLNLVETGLLSRSLLGHVAAWRLVLLLVGGPGLVWVLAIFAIREPPRRAADQAPAPAATPQSPSRLNPWLLAAPVYGVVALASLVDNAVGAWAPSLLIRTFAMAPGQVGLELGLVLAIGYGGGVFVGGLLADRAGARGGWRFKSGVCLAAGLAILPVSFLFSAGSAGAVLIGAPLYFALSGMVTAAGFSALLDIVPAAARGLAMAVSFFLNVAVGAGLGPALVVLAAGCLFPGAGLGPALTLIIAAGYGLVAAAALAVTVTRHGRLQPGP